MRNSSGESSKTYHLKNNMFYQFSQNNSWGSFIENDNVWEYVFIEAASSEEANDKAESIGIYFDGCETESDCECCWDRWFRQYRGEKGITFPYKYEVREILTSSQNNQSEKYATQKKVLEKYWQEAYHTFTWSDAGIAWWSQFSGTLTFKTPEEYAGYLMNSNSFRFSTRSDSSVKIYYSRSSTPVVIRPNTKS